jgi:hypothetical protein
VREAAAEDYRFSSLLAGIVRSDAFRLARVPEPQESLTTTAAAEPSEVATSEVTTADITAVAHESSPQARVAE